MLLVKDDRVNILNTGMMLLSCAAAFLMPFEVFLFAYAILGPLHYLTEISWLHDRQYFTKGKHDHVVLWVIGLLIAVQAVAVKYKLYWPFENNFNSKIIFIALGVSVLMVFVRNVLLKVAGVLVLLFVSGMLFQPDKKDGLVFLIGSLVPTLVHVYVFTGLFILFGTLKTRSTSGLLSFVVFIICPLLLFFLFRNNTFIEVTQYGKDSMQARGYGFFNTNISILRHFFGVQFPQLTDAAGNAAYYENGRPAFDYSDAPSLVFHSQVGILLMRFIAFAYTYHYLNWFSKTEIIRWHQVPKARFAAVIILWVASMLLYAYNYAVGLKWLYFLSLCHVLLEFPLNMISITGIGKEFSSIIKSGFKPKLA